MKMILTRMACALMLAAQALPGQAQIQISETWYRKIDQDESDFVSAICTDKYGNSYVTGNSYSIPPGASLKEHCVLTVKVNTNGQTLWTRNLFVPQNYGAMSKSIASDDSGNVYVLYQSRFDYGDTIMNRLVVNKYDPQGNTIWNKYLTEYQHGLTEEVAPREFIYRDGFLYCAGGTNFMPDGPANIDGFLYKVNAVTGNVVWRSVYDGPLGSDDAFRGCIPGPNGDVWVVGRSKGLLGPTGIFSDYDVLVARYNASGALQWSYLLNGSGNSDDIGLNLVVDAQGNSYHSSQVDVLGMGSDSIVVEKISPSGQRLWRHGFIGSNSGSTRKQPILLLPSGDVVVTSNTVNGITTFAMNASTGAELWRTHYSRAAQGAADKPYEMIADTAGNIYIAGGTRHNSGILDDVTTLKYNSSGVLQWYAYYNEPHTGSQDMGVGLALDGVQNVYTIGWVQDSLYNDDYFIAKYGNALPPVEPDPEPTAIKRIAMQDMKVYPNPADQFLIVERADRQSLPAKLILRNVAGQTVWQDQTTKGQQRIDLRLLPPGVYILEYADDKNLPLRKKVMIRH